MPNYDTMEDLWKEVNRTTTIEVTKETLADMRLSIRAGDMPPSSSRRSRM